MFTREFKLEAVKLIMERGVKVAQVSQDLGCIRPGYSNSQEFCGRRGPA